MSDGRSDRLRERRQKTSEKVEEIQESQSQPDERDNRDEPDESDNSVKPDNPDEPDELDEPDNEVTPVKQRDDWGPKQIHLSEDLADRLELQLGKTNVGLQEAGEDPLEKLMHWYPMIVQKGLDTLEEMDPEEIRSEADQFE